MKQRPLYAVAGPLLAILLCVTTACKAELESGVYSCKENEVDSCPGGWVCQQRGGLGFRCYASEGGFCGDGTVDPGEECDGQAIGDPLACGASSFPFCLTDCRRACTTCGNGKREVPTPDRGEECDDGNLLDGDGCSAMCKLPFCGDGLVDTSLFEGCDLGAGNSDTPDALCRRNCQPRRCGDGILDAMHGERCDDGNLDPTDDCTPDCLSDVRCGNGYVDFLKGELCDDGNFLSHDGCSSNCLNERSRWRQEPLPSEAPAPRSHHATAYDAARGRIVLFGGEHTGTSWRDTWEWDGFRWHSFPSSFGPSPRIDHHLVYDASSQRTFLFGGHNQGVSDTTTWEWDGQRWLSAARMGTGPDEAGLAAAYDPNSRRVIVLGRNETWLWDSMKKTWERAATPVQNPEHAVAAYDPKQGVVVLIIDHDEVTRSAWKWDSALKQWKAAPSQNLPALNPRSQITYDKDRQKLVLFNSTDSIFEADNISASWLATPPTGSTPDTFGFTVAFFDPQGKLLAISGYGNSHLWQWNGIRWLRISNAPALAPSSGGLLFSDRANGGLLLLQAMHDSPVKLWRFFRSTWNPIVTGHEPTTSEYATASYRESSSTLLLFGASLQAWKWDGAWREVPGPSEEVPFPVAVHHEATNTTVFTTGGIASYARSTWMHANEQWTRMSGSRPLIHDKLSYDPARRTVVYVADDWFGATVTFTGDHGDGRRNPLNHPPSGPGAMSFDHNLKKTILHSAAGTWAWDGVDWTDTFAASEGPPPARLSLAFNATERLTQGVDGTGRLWSFRFEHPQALDESCQLGFDVDGDGLIGCADPDCWPYCTPLCGPGQVCEAWQPRCGDGQCNAALETCRMCPQDCGACPARCGDFFCDPGETTSSCPGDCR